MRKTIELKVYPSVHRHIHGLIKNKIKQGSFFDINLLRWVVRRTIYHVPEKSRWETITEMKDWGMIRQISRDNFEWIRVPMKIEHKPRDSLGNALW